jgi:Resolvase, N terminal domain
MAISDSCVLLRHALASGSRRPLGPLLQGGSAPAVGRAGLPYRRCAWDLACACARGERNSCSPKALDQLDAGDVLMVTRLDRLARSTRDLLNTLATIADRKAGFRSVGDAWADTTSAHGRLLLTVLGGLAEFERELIRTRTGEGRARAKARGVKMGRPPKMTRSRRRYTVAMLANRCVTSLAPTTSRIARFRGWEHNGNTSTVVDFETAR